MRTLLLLALSFATAVSAQTATIRIRILNGHTGNPVVRADMFPVILPAAPGDARIKSASITDSNGSISITAPSNHGINAIVGQYPTCRRVPEAKRHDAQIVFPIAQIVSTGYVETNNCSHRTVPPIPGELTLFVRPLHWWERLSD